MINAIDYKLFSDFLALGQDQETIFVDYSDEIIDTLDELLLYLKNKSERGEANFYNSPIGPLYTEVKNNKNDIQNNKITSPVLMLSVVSSLQKHVENNYGEINDFLSDNSIKVKQTFADLSDLAGYEIEPGNIE